MTTAPTAYSDVESARFGLRIGRLRLDGADGVDGAVAALEAERLDVLIVRLPADALSAVAGLAALPRHRAIAADTLLYWRWTAELADDGAPRAPAEALPLLPVTDTVEVERLVRDVFADYPNHYAADPLLSRDGALAGYAEWATGLVASGAASCLVLADACGDPQGMAVVDWTPELPDIRLAGMLPAARGRGGYRRLMTATMAAAVDRGSRHLEISTQAHNTQVMRAWCDLGWRPMTSEVTFHVVRAELLVDGAVANR